MITVREHTETPGARYLTDGPFSGEWFRDEVLAPAFKEAWKAQEHLTVDLDGCYGYATGFLEEAFGGLARRFGGVHVRKTIRLISEDEPELTDEIWGYVNQVQARQGG